jgi:hypothetical protein
MLIACKLNFIFLMFHLDTLYSDFTNLHHSICFCSFYTYWGGGVLDVLIEGGDLTILFAMEVRIMRSAGISVIPVRNSKATADTPTFSGGLYG